MNKTAEYEFTIIVPVYNEEDNISELERAFTAYLPRASKRTCVLFVNDGSNDASGERIEEESDRSHVVL